MKNYPAAAQVTFQQKIMSLYYQYVDKDIDIQWYLIDEDKEVAGYQCKKAQCSYCGRDYTAWYAPEITISEGPYVFSGLPGLIMEIGDTKNNFRFTLNGFEQAKSAYPIYFYTKKVTETTRAEVRKIEKNSFLDRENALKNSLSSNVTIENMPSLPPRPYNPIELN